MIKPFLVSRLISCFFLPNTKYFASASKHVFFFYPHCTFFIPLSLWIGCSLTFLRFHPPMCTVMVWLMECSTSFKSDLLSDLFRSSCPSWALWLRAPFLHVSTGVILTRVQVGITLVQDVSVICWERPHRNVLPSRLRKLLGKEVTLCPLSWFRQVWWCLHSQRGSLAQGLPTRSRSLLEAWICLLDKLRLASFWWGLNPTGLHALLH